MHHLLVETGRGDNCHITETALGNGAFAEAKFEKLEHPEFEPRDHYHHFVDAGLGLTKTESFFAHTGPMAESILLGTATIRLPGKKLERNHAGPEAGAPSRK